MAMERKATFHAFKEVFKWDSLFMLAVSLKKTAIPSQKLTN